MRTLISPTKANPPLIIDSDAVKAIKVALQLLQSIAQRDSQIIQVTSDFNQSDLPSDTRFNESETHDTLAIRDSLQRFVSEGKNHLQIVT